MQNENILNIIKSKKLTYEQKVFQLAKIAENSIDILSYSLKAKDFISKGIICELFEGNIPYRPRYILPDYQKFLEEGSEFLGLKKPNNLYEVINNLLILYKHVPSITSFPVYIGNIDLLLDPYIINRQEAKEAIKLFLLHIDKTITDSFCHANIGPNATTAGEIILEVCQELELPTPNITLLYDHSITSDDFLCKCLETSLKTAKPSYANHAMFSSEIDNYAIASCYNGLKIAGGGYTLNRIKLGTLASYAKNSEDFFENWLDEALTLQLEIMDKRITFIVEESNFFNTNFLAKENLIKQENFTGMVGLVGLAECVNKLMELDGMNSRFGNDSEADQLGVKIINAIYKKVNEHKGLYCEALYDKYLMHAQVGIEIDKNESPGCRIPIGEEPDLLYQLKHSSLFHPFFTSGIGDVYVFDQTYQNNIDALLDIIKGAMNSNIRYLSLYGKDSDLVRVTGYLAKRSEIDKFENGEAVLRDTTALAEGAKNLGKALNRKVHE